MALELDHKTSAFPLSFMCHTPHDVSDIELIAPFVASLANLPHSQQMAQLERLSTVLSTQYVLLKQWSYWAVLDKDGGREFITSKW